MRRTECGIFSVKMKARARESVRESARMSERERGREGVDGTAADPRSCVIIELIIERGVSRYSRRGSVRQATEPSLSQATKPSLS